MPPTDPRDGPPDADGFLDPWSQGALIRYLAWLRQAYGAVPLPPPGDAAGLTGPGVPLEEVFVQPRVSHGDAHGRSLDVFDLLDDNRHVVVLGELLRRLAYIGVPALRAALADRRRQSCPEVAHA